MDVVKAREIERLQGYIDQYTDQYLRERKRVTLLEAGSGAHSYIRIPKDTYIVGIDVSEDQLRKNTVVDEKILGDIQEHSFEPAAFDVIICWTVLEHLQKPVKALNSFVRSTREEGIIILAVPNVFSIPGLVAKFTPHRFQVWAWRTLLGHKGYTPFRTYLKLSISPGAISRFASRNGLSVEYSRLYEPMDIKRFRQKYRIVNVVWRLTEQIVRVLSFGKVDVGLTEHIVVLKKKRPAN